MPRAAPLRLAGIAVAFALLSLALNRELLPHLTDALPGNAGDPMLNAWILGWVSDALIARPGELWNAPIFHPHANALAFSEHLIGMALFVAPVYWLTGNAILTYNIAFLAGYAFIGFALFVLVRALTGRADAGVVAGVVVACSPYLVSSQVARVQMLSAGWSVLTFFWLHRYLATSQRWALAAGAVCWALQLLSNTYLGVFLAVPVGVLLLVSFARRRPAFGWRHAGALAAAGAVLLAVAAATLLPYARAQHELGLAHSPDEVTRYSAQVRSYASVWHERESAWWWHEDTSDRALFPGVLMVGLAALGAVAAVRQRRGPAGMGGDPLAYVAMAALVFVLTLGPEPSVHGAPLGIWSPYGLLTDLVPGFDGFRAPGRFAVFVVLALGVLAGVGAASVLTGRGRGTRRGVLAVVVAVSLWDGHRAYDWLALLPDEEPSATAAYAWLAEQPRAAVFELPVVTHFQGQRPYAGGSVTLRYQLAALKHGHALVNGSSGFITPLVTLLQGHGSPLATLDTADDALRILRAIGTRYVVTHRREYLPDTRPHADAMQAAMRADAAQVEDVREFGSTVVLTLRPAPLVAPAAPSTGLANSLFAVAVSHDEAESHHLTDGDPGTRWSAPQGGGTWIEIRLHRPSTVSGVKLAMPRQGISDYPHHLRIVGTDPDGVEHLLYDSASVYDVAMTAVLEPSAPGLRVMWLPRAFSRVRLDQPVAVGDRRWTIHELEVLTASPAAAGGD